MEWLSLCALALCGLLDAVDAARTQDPSFQARTTRGFPLCLKGNGQQLQHLDGPAGQGTPCPSLNVGSLTSRLDRPLWPTDGSPETNDSDPKGGKGPGGVLENTWEYWSAVVIAFLIIMSAVLPILICCCYLTLCRRPRHPDPSESERLRVESTSFSLNDYGAITNVDAEGQDSTSPEDDDNDDNDDDDDGDEAPLLWTIDNDGKPVTSYRLKRVTEPRSASVTAV